MKFTFLRIYLVIALFSTCIAQTGTVLSELPEFENYLKEEVASQRAAGIEILINHKGENVWHKAFGYNSLQDNRILKKNSIYYIPVSYTHLTLPTTSKV